MHVLPEKDDFLRDAEKGVVRPLWTEPVRPHVDPAAAFFALREGEYSFLLDSARTHPRIGRYSLVGSRPYMVFKARGGKVEIIRDGRRATLARRPLEKLRELMANYRVERVPGLPPFLGGCAGFFSYDFVHNFERLPRGARDDLGIPEAYFIFVDSLAAFDHLEDRFWLIANPGASGRKLGYSLPEGAEWSEAYDASRERLLEMAARIDEARPHDKKVPGRPGGVKAEPLVPKEAYMEMVRRAKEYIAAGDIFQANLSQRLSADVGGLDPWDIYTVLREVNPSPFAAFIDFPDVKIASSSPERLVRLVEGHVETRPIAGTRPRGKDTPGDEAMRSELL